ncbi:hypothetical protein KIW84_058053 [Lathyrus oleraceus]|uniref:Uncharacterized protein n=1 Tax=Pisum sativum TaxID=3888 RepID=A0A9D5AIZ7_PEA|nr:hypothetical protein KIW84_058053 [Pisum sativum]
MCSSLEESERSENSSFLAGGSVGLDMNQAQLKVSIKELGIKGVEEDEMYEGQRDVSNHCPVWLKCEIKDWGPKPFRFIHGWFDHKDFLEFVENEWGCLKEGRGEGVLEVKGCIKRYFEESYKEDIDNHLVLTGIDFKEFLVGDNVMLEKPFSLEELKETIWDCAGDKTPGLNGFSLEFFKKGWDFLKEDLMNFLNEFFVSDKLPKALTASFIAIFPKVEIPQSLGAYDLFA